MWAPSVGFACGVTACPEPQAFIAAGASWCPDRSAGLGRLDRVADCDEESIGAAEGVDDERTVCVVAVGLDSNDDKVAWRLR